MARQMGTYALPLQMVAYRSRARYGEPSSA